MPLPATLTYNELDGTEVAHVLEDRFGQVLRSVPYLQRHLTLPRVRMTLQVKLEIWADQPHPETQSIHDQLEILTAPYEGTAAVVFTAESVDSAAPGPGGHPPDQIRETHGLPVARAGPGPRDAGAHIVTSDHWALLDGQEVDGMPGLKISRTGSGVIDGMPTSGNATVAKIDQGPAGLRQGNMNRDAWRFGGGKNNR
jgi:hypothetical protein